jgi:hypothetical protein
MASPSNSLKAYRAAMLREVYLPLSLAFVVILAGAGVMMLLPLRAQVSLMADWLWMTLVLLPAMLCLLPLAIGAIVMVFAAARLPGMARKPLERGQVAVSDFNARMTQVIERIQTVLLELSARMAGAERLVPLEEARRIDPAPMPPGANPDGPSDST